MRYIILQLYTPYWLIMLSSSSEAEVSSNAEPPKPANVINDLVNPGELIKQAQKESVLNNTFTSKAGEAKGMIYSWTYPTSLSVSHLFQLSDYYCSTLHMTLADQTRWVLCLYVLEMSAYLKTWMSFLEYSKFSYITYSSSRDCF